METHICEGNLIAHHINAYDLLWLVWTLNYGVYILVTLVDGNFHGNYVQRKNNYFMCMMYEIEFPLLNLLKLLFNIALLGFPLYTLFWKGRGVANSKH